MLKDQKNQPLDFKKNNQVVIEIIGGVAHPVKIPEGIEVIIIDHHEA